MTAQDVLKRLYDAGVRRFDVIEAPGLGTPPALKVSPSHVLTDDLRALIREHKAEIVAAILKRPLCPQCGASMLPSEVALAGERGYFCESSKHPRDTFVEWQREEAPA